MISNPNDYVPLQETEEVYEVDGTFVHRSRMTPLPGAGIAEEASIPGVPLKAAAKARQPARSA